MHTRKAMMTELTDAFVAIPGGVGTFDELFEAWSWNALGYHAKPIAVLDMDGFFDPLWAQAHVAHNPFVYTEHRESLQGDKFRIATMSLPAPSEMGEAYMAGIAIKANDPVFMRYFTLEHDFVLAKKANRTVLCERSGQKHSRIGDGPVLTGNAEPDARAFMDCFMELMIPTKVTKR